MTLRRFGLLGFAAAMLSAPMAQADEPSADCAAAPALPAVLAGWGRSAELQAIDHADSAALAASSPLAENRTAVSLFPMDRVAFRVAPDRAVQPDRFGGMIRIQIAKAGRLQVALGDRAWIDLVGDGLSIASAEHGHGPKCSGVRKIVGFDVEPGTYVLQIANAPRPAVEAMAIGPE